jgi:hypothetical protein
MTGTRAGGGQAGAPRGRGCPAALPFPHGPAGVGGRVYAPAGWGGGPYCPFQGPFRGKLLVPGAKGRGCGGGERCRRGPAV